MNKNIELLRKAQRVLDSCQTVDQLDVCAKYIALALKTPDLDSFVYVGLLRLQGAFCGKAYERFMRTELQKYIPR